VFTDSGSGKYAAISRNTPSSYLSVINEEDSVSLFGGNLLTLLEEYGLVHNGRGDGKSDFDLILESSRDAVMEMDKSGKILCANKSSEYLFGFSSEELIGRNFFSMVVREYESVLKRKMENGFEAVIFNKSSADDVVLFRGFTKLGRIYSFESVFVPIYRDHNPVFLAVIRRINTNSTLENKLRESDHNYDALSETLSEAIVRIDEEFKIIFANSAVKQVFGYEKDELIGKSYSILFPSTVFERYRERFKKYFFIDFEHRGRSGLKKNMEVLGKGKNRGVFPVEISFGNSRHYKGRSVTCIIRDITGRKNTERKLRHLAFHDKLTGLGNRDLFNMDLGAVLDDSGSSPYISALFFLDLDGFKQVNDAFGHDFGDMLLIDTARRIRGSLRETDSVYRFGGDEFVILIQNLRKKPEAAIIAQNVLSEIKRPFHLESMGKKITVSIGVSIGIVMIPENGRTTGELVKNADIAMYRAKNDGKGRYVFYKHHLDISAKERWTIEQGLRIALANNELRLHYQPIVTPEGKIRGFEALTRWIHPEKGTISPSRFIPVAEESGLINILDAWVLERALRDIKRINSLSPEWSKLYISCNISARQFENDNLFQNIDKVVSRTGADPSNIHIEITETSIVKNYNRVVSVITGLKRQFPELKFVLDDFGTGYSSLSYLSRIPIDSLKIDISFVRNLSDPVNFKVVTAIMNLAKSLDLDIVAEGVETENQRLFFHKRRCDFLQGYLFSEAVSINEVIANLKSGAFRG